MIGTLLLIVSALCGIAFGYAAQRGSICAVMGVEEWIEQRSVRQMLAYLRCSVWVVAVAVPLVWLDADAHLAPIVAPSLVALLGGLLFGVGATVNGGCAYGTINGLGAGDLSFSATLIGMIAGFWIAFSADVMTPAPFGRSPVETSFPVALPLMIAAILICMRELRTMFDRRSEGRAWSPERAVALMGISGGILHALHGSWAYTVALQGAVEVGPAGVPRTPLLILAATIVGAVIAAGTKHRFRLRLGARHIPARLGGGVIMGVGGAWVPGGNDALILHAAPALSPHALVAYPALIIGVAAGLLVSRSVRSWTPRRCLRSIVSWKMSGRE